MLRFVIALGLGMSVLITYTRAQENYNLTVRSHLSFPGKRIANIWGYTDSRGNEYALLGTSEGLSIVDVTNPGAPELLFEVPGVENNWREIRTWNGFAYVTSEGFNSGLTIVDLRGLPDNINTKVYRGDGEISDQLRNNHTLHIDNGYCYLYGSNSVPLPNLNNGGILILDLADPWNPAYAGKYSQRYVHDGYVAGDTVWACNVWDGFFTVIDVRDKSNPIPLATQTTPGNFTHNAWLTGDRKTLLTTDEVPNSFLTAYDVSNLDNITELDRFQTAPGSNSVVHNTHVLNDFAVTSWYTEGVVIVDAARPQNLVEVAKNDFTPLEGEGFDGCWGVYPYLPSGNILASDIQDGLYVLTPVYKRACYLEGLVTDSVCGGSVGNIEVSIESTGRTDITGTDGIFRMGTPNPGTYVVTFSKPGYQSKSIPGVVLQSGQVTVLDMRLIPDGVVSVNGRVSGTGGTPVPGAIVAFTGTTSAYQVITNNEGEYNRCDLEPDSYTIAVGKWGYVTRCEPDHGLSAPAQLNFVLEKGYYDDFQFHYGWTVSGNASSGHWTRVIPFGIQYLGTTTNPGTDVQDDCNGYAYVTGHSIDANNAGANDVDDGATILTSPVMDMSAYSDPWIHLYRWFYNGGGTGLPNDTLFFRLRQDGQLYTMKKVTLNAGMSVWMQESFRVRDYISEPGALQLLVEAADVEPGHLLEAGIDLFQVVDSGVTALYQPEPGASLLKLYPNPSPGGSVRIEYRLPGNNPSAELSVNDLGGRLLCQAILKEPAGSWLPGIAIAPGVYIVQLRQGPELLRSIKWVVQ